MGMGPEMTLVCGGSGSQAEFDRHAMERIHGGVDVFRAHIEMRKQP
jgi:hypothetical protein